jgi:DNA-binding response OmpR family regulator/HPt (histidine-containing phosphotransfer) domain-containing protein
MTESPPQEGLELGSAPLRDYFAGRLPERLREVEEAWEQARASDWQPEEARTFHRLSHSLAGAGATFGFPAVTEAARLLEQRLKPVVQGTAAPPDDDAVAGLLAGLRRASRQPPAAAGLASGDLAGDDTGRKSVLLVASDPELGPWLAQQLERFGYRVRLLEPPDRHSALAVLGADIERDPPSALLVDQMVFQGESLTGAQEISRLNRSLRSPMRTLFLSDRGDLESRLAAVRAGGEAYFTKPVDVGALIDQLDLLTGPPAEAHRALVIETDDEIAGECAGALRAAGLQVSVETDPERFLEALATSRPDVVLLGLELPGCSGAELAEVLHQIEGYVGTPVLFLAPAGSAEDRLTALELGGDELLTRPIDPLHLIAAVTSRARRGRRLASAERALAAAKSEGRNRVVLP